MKRRIVLLAAALFAMWATGSSGDEPLPSPFPPGFSAGHRLCETVAAGPNAGKMRSTICDLAGRPAVLIYTRVLDDAVATLVTKLDAVAQKGKEQKMRNACILLRTDEEDKESLRTLDKREKLGATILATHAPLQDGIYFGAGGRALLLPAEAEVTVILFQKLTVQSSQAFRKGELKDRDIAEIVQAAGALLSAAEPK